MTTLRQMEANRRNAQLSTGPKTTAGKYRASRNAIRHGMTAETTITPVENPEDYKSFEQAITADYDPITAVERELVLRLASLLWRLRRAALIETGLLQLQAEYLQGCDRDSLREVTSSDEDSRLRTLSSFRQGEPAEVSKREPAAMARCFLLLSDVDGRAFERLGRYESTIWRQARQTLFSLEALRRRAEPFNIRHKTWRRLADNEL